MDYLIDQLPLSAKWKGPLKSFGMDAIQWGDWFVGLRDPKDIIINHTSYFFNEFFFYICGIFTFVHAYRHGGRYMYLWLATVIHGLNTELIAYFVPDVDNFWHGQTSVMLFGRRAPLHILLLYPIFDYTATIAAKRLRLNSRIAEACAVGLGAVLIDIPYDIMGVKLLWWTWHDTDPNIADRMYHVPWTSYYFHASFACSFTLILGQMRRWLLTEEYDWKRFPREFFCAFVAGVSAFWMGALQFIPVYHGLHDLFGVHTEVCAMIFLGAYALIVWRADRRGKATTREAFVWFDELFAMLLIHYVFYAVLVVVAEPEKIVSTGLHEPIGPCGEWASVQTVSGLVLQKKKYLCTQRYDEPYFDFHCPAAGGRPPALNDAASGGSRSIDWYTICGVRFHNHVEYIAVIWALCAFALTYFYTCFRTSATPKLPVKTYKQKTQ